MPDSTKKTRLVFAPLMVSPGAAAPSMLMLALMAGNGVAGTVMVCPARPAAKAIVPPAALASVIACRSDPAPLSAVVVTVNTAANAGLAPIRHALNNTVPASTSADLIRINRRA